MVSKIWTFLKSGSDKSFFHYVKEVTFKCQMGTVAIGANCVIRVFSFNPTLQPQGKEVAQVESMTVNNDLINHAQVMKLRKNSLENFQVRGQKGVPLEKAWRLDAQLVISSSGLFLNYILYLKPVIY